MANNIPLVLLLILGIYQIQAKAVHQLKLREYFHRLDNYTKDDYINFAPIFQTYFVSKYGRLGAFDELAHFDRDSFWDRKTCLPYKGDRRCQGKVINCRFYGQQRKHTICLAKEDSDARYTAIADPKDYKYSITEENCPNNRRHVLTNILGMGSLGCIFKKCTCLNEDTANYRHFSLREVTSDIHRNRVVTGMRIEPNGHVFHLSIQEGEIHNGRIINNDWKRINVFEDRFMPDRNYDRVKEGRDYVTVTYEKNEICLQEFDLTGTNQLLTGVRFKEDSNAIHFQIRVTPYDIKTDQLKVNESHWLEKSPKVVCKKFEKSDDKYDGGQSVIPNIETRPLTLPVAVPLSGAGLAFDNKNFTGYGGIIYGKLFIADIL